MIGIFYIKITNNSTHIDRKQMTQFGNTGDGVVVIFVGFWGWTFEFLNKVLTYDISSRKLLQYNTEQWGGGF